MFAVKGILAGSAARSGEDDCGGLAENSCFYVAGNFVVQARVGVRW